MAFSKYGRLLLYLRVDIPGTSVMGQGWRNLLVLVKTIDIINVGIWEIILTVRKCAYQIFFVIGQGKYYKTWTKKLYV